MTREFEKYFPLPLSYDAVRGEMKTYGGIVVMQPSLWLMSNEQAEYADDFARHLTACANLMPEAVELINTLRIELGISCIIWCDKGKSQCKAYPAWEALRKAETFLAKLEGGGEQ